MKIIGKTVAGYIAEFSYEELPHLIGESFRSYGFRHYMRDQGALDLNGDVKIGVEFQIRPQFERLSAIRRHEKDAKEAAATLRALAQLLESQLPSVKIDEPPAAPEGGDA